MSVLILDAGPLALVEDLGRPGYASVGAGRSGAMDAGALRTVNRLLGNADGAAALELLGGGFSARLETATWISLAGGVGAATLDGQAVDPVLPVLAPAGAILRLGPLRVGLRRTLGVRGGIDAAPTLGSRSRDTLSSLGPEPLRAGDRLRTGRPMVPVRSPDWWPFDPPGGDGTIAVHPGPRLDRLPVGTFESFLDGPWRVSSAADRVGLRLDGVPLPTGEFGELPSEGMLHGSVQVPPSGLPVIVGPDHPVTGGYPVVAVVDSGSLDALAQLAPGSPVQLRRARRR